VTTFAVLASATKTNNKLALQPSHEKNNYYKSRDENEQIFCSSVFVESLPLESPFKPLGTLTGISVFNAPVSATRGVTELGVLAI